MMQFAKSKDKTVVFAPLRMPYMATELKPFTDIAVATFSYVVSVEPGLNQMLGGQNNSPVVNSHVFNALTQVLTGQLEAQGRAPVTLASAAADSKQK